MLINKTITQNLTCLLDRGDTISNSSFHINIMHQRYLLVKNQFIVMDLFERDDGLLLVGSDTDLVSPTHESHLRIQI